MNITDFLTMDGDGDLIHADTLGNDIAFNCMECYHPILASSKDGAPGNEEEQPVTFKGCDIKYFLDVRLQAEKLHIRAL